MEKGSTYLNPLTVDEYLDYRRVVIIEALKDAGATPQVLEAVFAFVMPEEMLEVSCDSATHNMLGTWILTKSKIEANKGRGAARIAQAWIFIPTHGFRSFCWDPNHWQFDRFVFIDIVVGSSLVNGKWVKENQGLKHNQWGYSMAEKP